MNELCFLTATALAELIRSRRASVTEVLLAHLAQIERVNPQVNAIVTLRAEQALDEARAADAASARGQARGPLLGLPVAHKDLVPTKGLRTTWGSPIYRDHVPDHDGLIVERLAAAGAITVGKTNTPEFGAGSQTFNEVFGRTLNPYDATKTCGGSSGGAAVAVACGMIPIADGSDMGGSLRNPASYCNVVGFRPSPGRVPTWPSALPWSPFLVEGPIARTVTDTALLLSAIAGPDPRSPIAIDEPGERFRAPLDRSFKGVRVAWSRDLGGLPVDARVTAVLDAQRPTFEALGCLVEDGQPDFSGAREIFQVWRAWSFEARFRPLLERHRDQLKDTVLWNIAEGQKITGPELADAELSHAALYHRVREFMTTREFLILPVTQVPPFDVSTPYVTEIDGVKLPTYIDWMRACSDITVTGLPAISVPCGFTPDGLPVGIQIVGRHHDDWGVLQLAHAFEHATSFWKRHPPLAAGSRAAPNAMETTGPVVPPLERGSAGIPAQDPLDSRRWAGAGTLSLEPLLLRVPEAGDLDLVAPYEWPQRAATQRVPGRGSPPPPGALPDERQPARDALDAAIRLRLRLGLTNSPGHERSAPMSDWTPPPPSRVEGYWKELNNWGRWGDADQVGTVNLITPAKREAARALVKTGRTVSLARDIGPQPALMYHATFPSNRERADVVLDRFDLVYHGYTITHIDALCHVAWDGQLYNGRPFMQSLSAAGATWCPIDPLFDGITTRGVLLDVASGRKEGYVTVGHPVTPRELDAAAARAGVTVQAGDVVVLRSGDESFRRAHPDWVPRVSPHPGLHLSCLEWFREKDIAAISWDMMDERPIGYPGFGMGVHLAIPFLGLALVDNTNPERLAVACREESRYEFLFTATPLRLVGSTGAPAHPLAIF